MGANFGESLGLGRPFPGVTGRDPLRSVIIRVLSNALIQPHPSPAIPSGDNKALMAAYQVSLLFVEPLAPFFGKQRDDDRSMLHLQCSSTLWYGVRERTMGQHTDPVGGQGHPQGSHCPSLPTQVVGVKDSRMGEEICACIRLRAGQDCTKEEIKAFCKGKVGSQLPFRPVHPVAAVGWWMKAHGFRALGNPALAVPGCSFQVV